MQPSIIIVGAGPNLGAAIARRFGREGLAVGLVARDAGKLEALAGELAGLGITAAYAAADIRDASALIMGGVLATYTYIAPLLTERAGIPAGAVPLVLVGFGVGALAGTTTGGRLGDRWPLATTISASAAAALVLLLLTALSDSATVTVILVVLMGLTGFAVNPVVTAWPCASPVARPRLPPR